MAKPSVTKKEPAPKPPLIWLRALILLAFGIWIYFPVLRGDWVWDDNSLISDNPQLRTWTGLGQLWASVPMTDYWPLSWTALWIEWHLFGNQPLGFHVVSLALHLSSAFLLWRLLERLGWREGWLGGLLFIVHPLTVESVAWLSEIKNTLSLPFFLLACHAYLDGEENKASWGYWRSVAFYLAAMLCKTSTVMLPVVLLLYRWSKSGKLTWQDVKKIIPYLLIALPLSLLTIYLQNHSRISPSFQLDEIFARLAAAGMAVLFYLGKFLWPVTLLPIYPRWAAENGFSLLAMALPGLALLGWWLWRGKDARCIWFGLGFFLVNLLPVIGLVKMRYQGISWVADHFAYLPMLGLIGVAVAGWQRIQARTSPAFHVMEIGLLAAVMALLALGSRSHAALFVDRETLWSYTLELNPNAAPAHNDLSIIALAEGRTSEALQHALDGAKIDSDVAQTHTVLGNVYFKIGKFADAEEQFGLALKLDPDSADAQIALGNLMAQAARFPEALDQFNRALTIRQNDPNALSGRGEIKRVLGDLPAALADLNQAIALDPAASQPYLSRGVIEKVQGNPTAALADLRRFRELAPKNPNADYAQLWIWIIRAEQKDQPAADQELSNAMSTSWNSAATDSGTENARFLLGQIKEADYLMGTDSPDKSTDLGRLCEARYYAGIKRHLAGDNVAAIALFHLCLATGKTDFFEYTLAQGELHTLELGN